MKTISFEAIGTAWEVELFSDLKDHGGERLKKLEASISQRIETYDKTYSRFRSDSLVTTMSQGVGEYTLPPDSEKLFTCYRSLYVTTGGLVTPLIGNLISDAGYDASYSLAPKGLSPVKDWDEVMTFQYPKLNLKAPVLLDFGAAGKGYLVDIVAEILRDHGVEAFCVDAGGDILYRNTAEPLRVGLENPDAEDEVIGVATITEGSICASAGNRRKWGTFTHIINPITKQSPTDIKATWVVAESGLLADGLATALSFTPAAELMETFSFSYALIRDGGTIESSRDFPAEFFT